MRCISSKVYVEIQPHTGGEDIQQLVCYLGLGHGVNPGRDDSPQALEDPGRVDEERLVQALRVVVLIDVQCCSEQREAGAVGREGQMGQVKHDSVFGDGLSKPRRRLHNTTSN